MEHTEDELKGLEEKDLHLILSHKNSWHDAVCLLAEEIDEVHEAIMICMCDAYKHPIQIADLMSELEDVAVMKERLFYYAEATGNEQLLMNSGPDYRKKKMIRAILRMQEDQQ